MDNLKKGLKNYQDWIEVSIGPLVRAILALSILIYLYSLIFSYEELFGSTPDEEPIRLIPAELDAIRLKVDKTKAPEEFKEPSRTTLSFKPGKNKKQLPPLTEE